MHKLAMHKLFLAMHKLFFSVAVILMPSLAGALAAGLGDFLAGKPEGSWNPVPDTSILDVCPPKGSPDAVQREGYSRGCRGVINAWTGAAFDGTRMYFHGGGSRYYGGNEVYAFDTDTMAWELFVPNTAMFIPYDGTNPCPGLVDDSVPAASHTYDGLVFVRGWLYTWGVFQYCKKGWGGGHGNLYRLDAWFRVWSHLGEGDGSGASEVALDVGDTLDPDDDTVLVAGGTRALFRYDPVTNTSFVMGSASVRFNAGSMELAPEHGVLFYITNTGAAFDLVGWDWVGGGRVIDPRPAGERKHPLVNAGIVYDPIVEAFVVWDGEADIVTYRPLDWADPTGDWTKATFSPLCSPVCPTLPERRGLRSNGVYGKFAYDPVRDAFLGYNNHLGDFFVLVPPADWNLGGNVDVLLAGEPDVVLCAEMADGCTTTALQDAVD
jgi:hypothetical protein